jgi:hypothetical protein
MAVTRPEVYVELSKAGMKLLLTGCWRSDRQVLSRSMMRGSLEPRLDHLEARSDRLERRLNRQVLSKVAVWRSNRLRPLSDREEC